MYLLPMSRFAFIGTFNGNTLQNNMNRRSGLIVGSSVYDINYNLFINPQMAYDLEVEYNDDNVLDATQNYWSM